MFAVLLAAVLPALALLYFIYRKDDLRTEPPKMVIRAFLLGMLAAFASILVSTPLELSLKLPPAPYARQGGEVIAAMLANVPVLNFPEDDPKYDSSRKYNYA